MTLTLPERHALEAQIQLARRVVGLGGWISSGSLFDSDRAAAETMASDGRFSQDWRGRIPVYAITDAGRRWLAEQEN